MKTAACILVPAISLVLAAAPDPPLQVGQPLPQLLDLITADPTTLIPRDSRDPAQVEAAGRAWTALTGALAQAPALRLRLPAGATGLPMLLAASQALRAGNPGIRLYVAFQPGAQPLMDERAWGAVDGGALAPEDLGPDPDRWRDRLVRAQEQLPGRPWTLWPGADPGALTGVLLGDGGKLVVPPGGPAAALAAAIPAGFLEVEGGSGDLTLGQRQTGQVRRWTFDRGRWLPAAPVRDRHEVQVLGQESYDVGALLARMRATQLRDRNAIRTSQATLEFNMHFQGERGNTDLGFKYRAFDQAGEPEEALREQLTYNGVAAKLHGDAQLPIVEARSSLAPPVALALSERFHYSDGGPAGPGQRLIKFEPVDADPSLAAGVLRIEEASGRILEERSQRSGLPGIIRSEQRVLTYGEPAPGLWRVLRIHSTERWLLGGDTIQVLRQIEYRDFRINDPGFQAARAAARASDGSMIQQTVDGARYYTKQKDGTRKAEDQPRSSGRAAAGVVLIDPSSSFPVLPLAGMMFFDLNAWGKGIQYSFLTAVVFNNLNLTVPDLGGGVALHTSATLSALAELDQPVVNGQLLDKDGVEHRAQNAEVDLSRDLGYGFRLNLSQAFTLDSYATPGNSKYATPGFSNPASGFNAYSQGQLTWQRYGFQLRSYYGAGHRPDRPWGEAGALEEVPDQGRYQRWGGAAVHDLELGKGFWLQTTLGEATGRNFDRFQAINFSGMVAGIKPDSVVANQLAYGEVRLTVPTGPHLRLNLGLDHGIARSQDDQKRYGFTGLIVAGDLPGFWWFTAVNVTLGIGLQSDIPGVRTVNGMVTFIRLL